MASKFDPLLSVGLLLLFVTLALAALSHQFPYGVELSETPVLVYIACGGLAGALWLGIIPAIDRTIPSNRSILCIVLLGMLMRVSMFVSVPVLEDDSYRYLWDGAVVAHGIDPYRFAPAEAFTDAPLGNASDQVHSPDLVTLQHLAAENRDVHRRINYPYVSTIYPPLAQAAFAIAHLIDPFGLAGWRFILLIAELVTLGLLLKLISIRNLSPLWLAIYWWNPVVILQGFGAGHMDLLLLPFLLSTLLFAQRNQFNGAALALAGATAIKLWPVLLFPLLVRPLWKRPKGLFATAVLFGSVSAAALAPQLVRAFDPDAGLNAYAADWRTHAFLFSILQDGVLAAHDQAARIARLSVLMMLLAIISYLTIRANEDSDRLINNVILVVACLIFLSPTGYPWYLIWFAPLLALARYPALICLTVLAPLYWFRFVLGDDSAIYQWGVVPIAFGLPLLLAFKSLIRRRVCDAHSNHYPRSE